MTQTWEDSSEKVQIAERHRKRIDHYIKMHSFRCPWCGEPVVSMLMDIEALAFDAAKLNEGNCSVGVRGLFLHPGKIVRAHHRTCEGWALRRKDMRRFQRAPGFGFGADVNIPDPWEGRPW